MKKGVIAIILLFFLLVISIVFSQSNLENEKVDSEVEELLEGQNEVSVIVVLEDDSEVLEDYSTSELEEKDDFEKKKLMIAEQQEEVLSELDLKDGNENNFDFELESKFSTVNGFSGEVTEEGLEKLASDPNVKKIYPNRPVSAFLSDSKNIVNASKTWSLIYNSTNITGKGEVICVIDTGVDYTHSDMGACASTSNINDGSCAKVIGGYDFINSDQNPADDHGHGTHVAGIVASTNITYRGIAPDANIVAIKSLDETGSGNTSTIVNGIDWCVNNASIFNITVISMSLGTSTLFSAHCDDSDPLNAAAIDAAIAKNVSVVVATGNAGSTTGIASPACIKNSTAVGATKKDNSMVYNRNNITDLLAPGFSITSLNYTGGIITFGGTSMATPMVAGAFALLHQYFKLTENRNATPTEIEDTLNDTGKQIDDTSGSGFFFSRINIFAAMASLDTTAPNIVITNPGNSTTKKNISFIVNITSDEVLNNATLEINNTNFTMEGLGIEWSINISSLSDENYTYKVYGNDSFGNKGTSETFSITIGNAIPTVVNVTINSTDSLNRTNGTLQGFFTTSDLENDVLTTNNTRWYNNTEEVIELINYTSITSNYTKKNQNWTFSIRVFDGTNWSNWVNSTNLTIKNAAPAINITIQNITVNESDLVNINLSGNLGATDIDNDTLTFTYSSPLNSSGQWQTGFTDARNYTITINVSDNDNGFDTQNVIIVVLDKVSGANDTFTGNITDIKTTVPDLQLKINGTSFNLDNTTVGLNEINFSDSGETIVVFDFNFTNTSKFNFNDIIINKTKTSGAESLVIRGIDLSSQNRKKILYLNRTNTTFNSICVKDTELSSIDELSSDCSGSDETKLACDGVATSGLTCTLSGTVYEITGLSHSGIKQISFTRSSGDSGSPSSSGGSSGGGGGGGGGGSGLSYTCNMDWSCGEWSNCDGKWQTRECEFVKVAQHTQSEKCPVIDKVPLMARKCEVASEIISAFEAATEENVLNESEMSASPTGAAVAETKGAKLPIGIVIVSSIIVLGIAAYYAVSLRKK